MKTNIYLLGKSISFQSFQNVIDFYRRKKAGLQTHFFTLFNRYLKHRQTQIRYLYFTDVLSICNT